MEYRTLAGTDLKVSRVGIGGNTFGPPRLDEAQSIRTIHAAQDLGVTYVDTSMAYTDGHSEDFIGKALEGRRDKWVIATKYNFRGRGETSVQDHIFKCADNSLRKLRTDRIDLFQLHSPDLSVREEDILLAMDKLIRAGKVREIGASTHQAWHLARNVHLARAMGVKPYISQMDHYNLLRRQIEQDVIPFAKQYDFNIIAYFPLAGGFLTGKYKQGEAPPPGTRGAEGSGIIARNTNERNYAIVRELEKFVAARGKTMIELAIAWLLANPNVPIAVTGVSSPEQVAANVTGADWKMSAEDKAELDRIAPRIGDDNDQPVGAGRARPAG